MQTWRRQRRPSSSKQASTASIWYLWLASFLVGPQRFWLVLPREEDNGNDKKRTATSCSPPPPPPTPSPPSSSPTDHGRHRFPAASSELRPFQTWLPAKHMKVRRSFVVSCPSSLSSDSPPSETKVDSAEACVHLALSLFAKGRVKDALTQFDTALHLNPNPVDAQAALYNKACCHAYRGEATRAAESLRTALRQYDLQFSTILNDPDLASFRASPEFKELQEEAMLGGENIGYGFRRDLKLISEVQAPLRGVRRFYNVAFSAAAGISTFFTVPRLIRAIQGGEGAPDIWETAGNVAINIGGDRD